MGADKDLNKLKEELTSKVLKQINRGKFISSLCGIIVGLLLCYFLYWS